MGQEVIPARKGKAVSLNKGNHIKVINTYGTQVVDAWAFNAADLQVPTDFRQADAWHSKVASKQSFCDRASLMKSRIRTRSAEP